MALEFSKFANEGNNFVNDLAKTMGCPEDREKAARTLQSVLWALRGQLTTEESVQLISQFPFFLKAVYVHNWKLQKKKRIKHFDDFILEVCQLHGDTAQRDFPTDDHVENAISAVILSLRRYISLGELEDLKAVLPKDLKPMFNTVLMV